MRLLLIILLLPFISAAQLKYQNNDRQAEDTLPSNQPVLQVVSSTEIFQKIEHGLQANSVDEFQKDFSAMVAITIGSVVRGYYSGNEAASVLTAYLSERRLVSFVFSQIHESSPLPYATGRLVYIQKGIQESSQVYVSLTQQDSLWVISQFNIY